MSESATGERLGWGPVGGGGSSGGSGSSGSGSSGGFDAEAFVTRIVEQFESRTGYHLSSGARAAVITPAREHRQQITEELHANKVLPEQIVDAVETVLANAMRIAIERGKPMISDEIMVAAMKLECRYFPWC